MIATKTLFVAGVTALAAASLPKAASACTPYGLIGQKWTQLKGALGNCVNDEASDSAGGRIQTFQYGWVDWDGRSSQAFAVYGLIGQKWHQLGLAAGYGHPTTDETESGTERGRYNLFTGGGVILFRQGATQAYEVHGTIEQTYDTEGAEFGALGFPISDELSDSNGSRINYFEHGTIYWTPNGVSSTLTHVYNQRYTIRAPHFGFNNSDPVGVEAMTLDIYSNGNYVLQGGFHTSSPAWGPEETGLMVAVKSNDGTVYQFEHKGSVGLTSPQNDPSNGNLLGQGTDSRLVAGWSQLEAGMDYQYNAMTSIDFNDILSQLWSEFQTIWGYVQKVEKILGA